MSSNGYRLDGRYFHSANMTFSHYEFASGSSIHEHLNPEEEVYEVIEGELEVTIDGKSQVVKPGVVAIVPANSLHSVRSLMDGRLIVMDHQLVRTSDRLRPLYVIGHLF